MYKKELQERKRILEKAAEDILKKRVSFPEGNLRVQKRGLGKQYFQVTDSDDCHGTYIKADEIDLAKALAQKSYCEKLLKQIRRELKGITAYLSSVEGTKPEDVYATMNQYRQELVTPIFLSDEEYAKEWEAAEYIRNPYRREECVRETKKGDLVRSKSEEMLANMYYDLGIPYRYEAEVRLKNGKVKYPDFVLLNVKERKEIYHEHLGLMDDDFYRDANITKLKDYTASGIYCCKNLIVTMDTDSAPMNMNDIRHMVKDIFFK